MLIHSRQVYIHSPQIFSNSENMHAPMSVVFLRPKLMSVGLVLGPNVPSDGREGIDNSLDSNRLDSRLDTQRR